MFDLSMLILLPAIILSLYAQFKVNSAFSKYSGIGSRKNITGAEVARQLLASQGVSDVEVQRVSGRLTDHYDPRTKVLRLSDSVFGSTSLAAIGVAAHETGHAVQHNVGYVPLNMRNSIFPAVNISSNLAMPLVFLGVFLTSFGTGDLGFIIMQFGILLFTCVVAFQLITLPVEFDASKRAIEMLDSNYILQNNELPQAKKVLDAAALTYVAAAASAVLNLLRLIMISNSRRRG